MAKITEDKKGLAGIVKNVPRELDIKGQKHMLAWITPKEGETLKALGGAGVAGPMDIPTYFDGFGDDRTQAGEDSSGGYGGDPQGDNVDRSDAGDDSDDSPSRDVDKIGSDDDENEDQDVQQDIALRDYLDDKEDRNWVENRMLNKLKKANLEQYTGLSPAQYNARTGVLTSYQDKFSPFQSGQANVTYDEDGVITSYEQPRPGLEYDPKTDQYTGYREDVNLPGSLGFVAQALGLQPNVYTGFGVGSQPDEGRGGDGPDRPRISGLTSLQEEPKVEPVSVSPADYYGKGIGSATIDMSDPLQREQFLMNLYGYTPSPIGATFDQPTSSYTIPGGSKKSRTRLRGLDIFKPVTL